MAAVIRTGGHPVRSSRRRRFARFLAFAESSLVVIPNTFLLGMFDDLWARTDRFGFSRGRTGDEPARFAAVLKMIDVDGLRSKVAVNSWHRRSLIGAEKSIRNVRHDTSKTWYAASE